jgi:hypothetical protein
MLESKTRLSFNNLEVPDRKGKVSVRGHNGRSLTRIKQLNITTSFINEFPDKQLFTATPDISSKKFEGTTRSGKVSVIKEPAKSGMLSVSSRISNASLTGMNSTKKRLPSNVQKSPE